MAYENEKSAFKDISLFANTILAIKIKKSKGEDTKELTHNCQTIFERINHRMQENIKIKMCFPLVKVFQYIEYTTFEKAIAMFLIAIEYDAILAENSKSVFTKGIGKTTLIKTITQSDVPYLMEPVLGENCSYSFFDGNNLMNPFLMSYALGRKTFEDTSQVKELLIYEQQALELVSILERTENILINLYGDRNCGKTYFVKFIAEKLNKELYFLDFGNKEIEETKILNEIYLFSKLEKGIVYIKNLHEKNQKMLEKIAEGIVIVASYHKDDLNARKLKRFIKVHLSSLSTSEKIKVWNYFKEQYAIEVDAEAYGNKYVYNIGEICNVFDSANLIAKDVTEPELLHAIKMRDYGLQGADLIETEFGFQDLVVEEAVKRQLDHIISQLEYKNVLYEQWGFQSKVPYGRGISVLFYGPPGTGKTMTASVIANELNLDLYRVDISKLISKYIGETEKNISSLFDKAKDMNIILFFDEADALFAKRSEVKDSHDKNANAETAHLLQKLEEYEGISILATNLFEQIDDAFKRRIKFMIPFKLPDAEVRIKLWKKMLPEKVFLGEVDVELFAKNFDLSGSQIKEIVVNASFIALSEGELLGNEHLKEAIVLNYQKYGKRITNDDFLYLA